MFLDGVEGLLGDIPDGSRLLDVERRGPPSDFAVLAPPLSESPHPRLADVICDPDLSDCHASITISQFALLRTIESAFAAVLLEISDVAQSSQRGARSEKSRITAQKTV
jgi:hypothetical protein